MLKNILKAIGLILLASVVLSFVYSLNFLYPPKDEDFKTSGTVFGKVSIGPLCPVEPCTVPPESNPYASRNLIFTPKGGGRPADLPFTSKLNSDGSFNIELPESDYEISLSDCQFMGCQFSLPKMISVKANQTLELNLDIDTGIR